jgi:hypothetical protein
MTTPETPAAPRRRWRYFLISLAAFAVTIALFYAEEDWRGRRALEHCQRELEAEGISLDWTKRIPAPVPENENVFGVPEMQKWFVKQDTNYTPGRIGSPPGPSELTKKFHYPAWGNATRMVVAHLMIGLPGAIPPAGSAVVQWGDPAQRGDPKAQAEAVRLIKEAIGPVALDPAGFCFYTKELPGKIRAAQIFLQCQAHPAEKQLQTFLPNPIINPWGGREKIEVERASDGSYNVIMETPGTAEEYLKWNEQLEPVFALIRNTLQRPYARLGGDYSQPSEMPIPNFIVMRMISQRLSALARCHLLLSQPEEALGDLTLIRDICRRLLEENKPMTLVSAMINVAISGLYASVVADGMKMQAWREPQLAALEGQLKQINLLAQVKPALETEEFSACYHLTTLTPVEDLKLININFTDPKKTNSWKARENLIIWRLIPSGWSYQNALTAANLYTNIIASLDPASPAVFPDKTGAFHEQLSAMETNWSPYSFMALPHIPNFVRACNTTVRNQTDVNQTLVACALERYRLAHGEYPETLDALIPQFVDAIPHDVIGGQPPHYRRTTDGTFLLYSIGWSQQDHGGQPDSDLVWPEN